MTTSEWIAIIGIATSLFVTTVGGVLILSFKIGGIHERITSIEKAVEDIPRIKYTSGQMQVKLDVLWQHHLSKSNSPMVLNEAGLQALEASKVGTFADHHYQEILWKVKAAKPLNAYQAQELLIYAVNDYQHLEECRLTLQDAAFSSGYDVDSLCLLPHCRYGTG